MCHPGAVHTVIQQLGRDLERALLTFARDTIDQALLPKTETQQPARASIREIVRKGK